MDPGVAMRRAAMMDDDMDSAGVEDKDGGKWSRSSGQESHLVPFGDRRFRLA